MTRQQFFERLAAHRYGVLFDRREGWPVLNDGSMSRRSARSPQSHTQSIVLSIIMADGTTLATVTAATDDYDLALEMLMDEWDLVAR